MPRMSCSEFSTVLKCLRLSFFIGILILPPWAGAGKVMVFDENKGIIFLDEAEAKAYKKKLSPAQSQTQKSNSVQLSRQAVQGKSPEALFEVGSKYFTDENFNEALYFFDQAYQTSKKPLYLFWAGRTYRRLNQDSAMVASFEKLLALYPKSDLADDACFFLGAHHRVEDHFQIAKDYFSKLLSDYEDSHSATGELDYKQEASQQLTAMRQELTDMLATLGFDSFNSVLGLKAFQIKYGLQETGIADHQTLSLLRAENEKAKSAQTALREKKALSRGNLQQSVMILGGASLLFSFWLAWLWFRLHSIHEGLQSLTNRLEELKAL